MLYGLRTPKRGGTRSRLQDVLAQMIKDLQNAESQLAKALPKMADAAAAPELAEAIRVGRVDCCRPFTPNG
jgi:hypothetical protein